MKSMICLIATVAALLASCCNARAQCSGSCRTREGSISSRLFQPLVQFRSTGECRPVLQRFQTARRVEPTRVESRVESPRVETIVQQTAPSQVHQVIAPVPFTQVSDTRPVSVTHSPPAQFQLQNTHQPVPASPPAYFERPEAVVQKTIQVESRYFSIGRIANGSDRICVDGKCPNTFQKP